MVWSGNQLRGSNLNLTLDNRSFEDPHGIFYPKTTRVLVITAKNISGEEISFPFQLRLERTMKVDIHDPPVLGRVMSFRGKPEKDDCWCFNIRAPYKAGVAKDALEDVIRAEDNKEIPSVVGLRAAAKPWIDAQGKWVSIHTSWRFAAQIICKSS